ncbi:MAG TPA: hypothetical protein VME67_12000 [Mycobacterium sp.]|nr:hypothetical protein [Mycobacterium sp.]HTX95505.1 hypothetical protein [Mycobacterium sp.]
MNPRTKILIAIATTAFLAGICGAIAYGFWAVSQGCHTWVDSHGYRLVRNDWWAKTRGCVAVTPTGGQVSHSEDFPSKAIGWVWQLAIFAAGALPAAIIVLLYNFRWRRGSPGADP